MKRRAFLTLPIIGAVAGVAKPSVDGNRDFQHTEGNDATLRSVLSAMGMPEWRAVDVMIGQDITRTSVTQLDDTLAVVTTRSGSICIGARNGRLVILRWMRLNTRKRNDQASVVINGFPIGKLPRAYDQLPLPIQEPPEFDTHRRKHGLA